MNHSPAYFVNWTAHSGHPLDCGFLALPPVLACPLARRVGAEMIRPSEHLCGETEKCVDCEAWCCRTCSEEIQSGTVVVRVCNRCADAEEADREEMP